MSKTMTKTPVSRATRRSYGIHDVFEETGDEPVLVSRKKADDRYYGLLRKCLRSCTCAKTQTRLCTVIKPICHRPSFVKRALPRNTNDDEKEKLEYRRRLAEKEEAERKKSSVGGDDGRKSFGGHLPGFSAQQLSEHYNNCLQLFNENKITQKNAFNLQLIDYMAMMLKKRDKQMDNFSVVSCTLDASTKIYAYRVDHVHSDALKMAGGLAAAEASNKNKQSKEDDSDDADEMGDSPHGKEDKKSKRKKRFKQRNTIVPNPESLNRKTFELGSWHNRLLIEAGESSILSNATLVGESCAMQLNNDTKYWITSNENSNKVSCKEIPLKVPVLPENAKISETLDGFSIVNWDENEDLDDEDMEEDPADKTKTENDFIDRNLVFDPNEPVQPIPEYEPDFFDDRPDDIDSDAEEVIGQERLKTARKSTKDAITDLHKLISTEPLEYSYFQNSLISMWRGPAHWKIKPLSRFQEDEEMKQGQQKRKDKMRRTKNLVDIDFDSPQVRNFNVEFKQSRQTQLTKVTILKWNRNRVTASPDAHYTPASLFRLFLRPCLYVRSKPLEEEDNIMDEVENVVKPFEEAPAGVETLDNTTNGDVEMDNDPGMDVDNDDAGSFHSCVADDAELPNTDAVTAESNMMDAFVGDNLVAAPNKIAKVSVQYALRPKTVDMKKLKGAMWECISSHTDINKENTPRKSSSVERKKVIKFSEIQDQIKSVLPKKLVEDLNCSLCLVALLHLANEKNLCVQGMQDHSDLIISQG